MKKNLIIILAIIFLFSLSSCGKKEEEKGVVTLRWSTDPNPLRGEQISLFEKNNPGIKIKLDWTSAGLEKILTQTAGGNPPDLMDIHSRSTFNIFIDKGIILDVTPYCEKYNVSLDVFWLQCRPWMEYKGKIYAFPTNAADFILFYNKRLFDEAGLGYPTGKWTWEDLLEAAKRVTKVDPRTGRHTQFGLYWPSDRGLISTLIWQNKGMMYTEDGKRCIINSSEAKEAVRFLYDLRFKHHVMPSPIETRNIGTQGAFGTIDLFAGENVAMYPCGRWAIISFRKNKNLDWGIAPLPKKKQKANLFLTRTTAISKLCKHPEEAFKFLLFLTTREYNELISHSGDSLPACISIAKSDIFLSDPAYPEEKNNQFYLDEMKYSRNAEMSPYISDIEVTKIWDDEFGLMWVGKQSPEEALDKITKRINKLIAEGMK